MSLFNFLFLCLDATYQPYVTFSSIWVHTTILWQIKRLKRQEKNPWSNPNHYLHQHLPSSLTRRPQTFCCTKALTASLSPYRLVSGGDVDYKNVNSLCRSLLCNKLSGQVFETRTKSIFLFIYVSFPFCGYFFGCFRFALDFSMVAVSSVGHDSLDLSLVIRRVMMNHSDSTDDKRKDVRKYCMVVNMVVATEYLMVTESSPYLKRFSDQVYSTRTSGSMREATMKKYCFLNLYSPHWTGTKLKLKRKNLKSNSISNS